MLKTYCTVKNKSCIFRISFLLPKHTPEFDLNLNLDMKMHF